MPTCSVDGCERQVKAKVLCNAHYLRSYLYGRLNKFSETESLSNQSHEIAIRDGRRSHRLYHLWHERKQKAGISPEWTDFWSFVRDVGKKPDGDFTLVRLRGDEPYGPNNFEWRAHLKREPGESKKDWYARKWKSRRERFPEYETRRYHKRKYGLTPDQFDDMQKAQQNLCAICNQPESTFEAKSGSIKRLSIDHDHKTGRVRALLCFRCNSVIGKVNESVPLLNAMVTYLTLHYRED